MSEDICQSMTWTGDEDAYCFLREGHDGPHDNGEGWEW